MDNADENTLTVYMVRFGKYYHVCADRAEAFSCGAELAEIIRQKGDLKQLDSLLACQYILNKDRLEEIIKFVKANSLAYAGTSDPDFDAEQFLRPAIYDPQHAAAQQINAFYGGLIKCFDPDEFWVAREVAGRLCAKTPDYPEEADPHGHIQQMEIDRLSFD
ncbi:MAG: hypothetical protein LUE27_06115 [Clostridia bacterium]|nr:hypothetical protein [Clostridia bacterium]